MAGVRLEALAKAVAPARACVTMMPGHANVYGAGPSILYPADPFWAGFLAKVGPVHGLETAEAFDTAAVFGAMSGASFVFLQQMIGWYVARHLVAETFRGNAEVLLRAPESLESIVAGVATPGGITEQLVAELRGAGALAAWEAGMDAVLARMRGM
jgi:pyrroline-5-carboxylate reductase